MPSCPCESHTDACYAQELMDAYPLGGGLTNDSGRFFELVYERGTVHLPTTEPGESPGQYIMAREARNGPTVRTEAGVRGTKEIIFSLWLRDEKPGEAPYACVADDHGPDTGFWYTRVFESESCYAVIEAAHERRLFASDKVAV